VKTEAVYITEPGEVEIREIDVPDPGPGEVQIRCIANGICMVEVCRYTGVEAAEGPVHAGHEGIGVVEKLGAGVTNVEEGDRVHCWKWSTLQNRGAGELLPFRPPPEDPACWLTEPPACVVGALDAYQVAPGDRALVLGAGYMGLLNVQALAHCPLAELVVCDLKPRNLELAEQFGASETVRAGTPEGQARLDELRDDPFDLVVEAAGVESTLQAAGGLTRPGGRLGVFAWHHDPRSIDFGEWHVKGIKTLNVGPRIAADRNINTFKRAIRLMLNGTFDQRQLITHRHPLSQVKEALEVAAERPPEYIKGVILFEE